MSLINWENTTNKTSKFQEKQRKKPFLCNYKKRKKQKQKTEEIIASGALF